jgi:hypothetical protein
LGLLNSKLADYFLKSIASTKQNGFYEHKPMYISKIPVFSYTAQLSVSAKIENLVQKILSLKELDPGADTAALEAEIDRLVYSLYDLTEAEIRLVEGG